MNQRVLYLVDESAFKWSHDNIICDDHIMKERRESSKKSKADRQVELLKHFGSIKLVVNF